MVYKFFNKKSLPLAWSKTLARRDKSASRSGNKNKNISNQELAEEFYKPIIRKFKKEKNSPFIDNIWGVDLADMQSISKFNKRVCFLLSVTDTLSKYAWVIPLKDKKGVTITNAFQKILDEYNHKPK